MNKILLISLLFFCSTHLHAQQIPQLKVEQLKSRIFKSNDSTYVINFFATWCGPCMKEIPALLEFANNHKSEAVKLILVSLDFKSDFEKTLPAFKEKYAVDAELFFLDEPNPDYWVNKIDSTWTAEIPATLFYNYQKKVKVVKSQSFSVEELESTFQKLIN